MLAAVEFPRFVLQVPSPERIEEINTQSSISGTILQELYQSRRFIGSDVISVAPFKSAFGQVVAVKAVYRDEETDEFKLQDLRLLTGLSQALLREAEEKIESLPLDSALVLRSFDRIHVRSADCRNTTYAAMEIIGDGNQPQLICGARILHPIDFEVSLPPASPRRVANQYTQFFLSMSPIYRL